MHYNESAENYLETILMLSKKLPVVRAVDIANELGYKTVFWSCAYDDWDNNRQMSREKALDKLMSRLHNGEVLLLHPTSSTNAAILDEFMTTLKSMGYRFGNLYELTGNSMIQPR